MNTNSPVNIVAKHEIWPDLIDDYWFTESAWLTRMRDKIQPFGGGTFTKSVFRFRPLNASFFKMGATFNITKPQTLGEMVFDMKFCQTAVAEYMEELQVYAKGPNAVFSLLDEDLENALSSISDLISFSAWGDGQTDDSVVNGFAELMGHPTLPSWNSLVATQYAQATRSDYSRGQINGNIYWGGNPNGTVGPINFDIIEQAYRAACKGPQEPDVIILNKKLFSACLNKLEAQYRVSQDVQDPYWGGTGFKFHNAYVMVDEHAPSKYGLTDDDNYGLGNYKTAAFTNPLTGTPDNNFPNATDAPTLDPGEVMFIVNTNFMVMRMSDDPLWGFGFTGFQKLPDSYKVVGQVGAALNFESLGPRYHAQVYGFGG